MYVHVSRNNLHLKKIIYAKMWVSLFFHIQQEGIMMFWDYHVNCSLFAESLHWGVIPLSIILDLLVSKKFWFYLISSKLLNKATTTIMECWSQGDDHCHNSLNFTAWKTKLSKLFKCRDNLKEEFSILMYSLFTKLFRINNWTTEATL